MTADATTPTPEERTGADMTLEEWRDERRRRQRERREAQFQREKEFHERRERERLERKRAPETPGAVATGAPMSLNATNLSMLPNPQFAQARRTLTGSSQM